MRVIKYNTIVKIKTLKIPRKSLSQLQNYKRPRLPYKRLEAWLEGGKGILLYFLTHGRNNLKFSVFTPLFLMLVLPRRTSFLTTFYGLYFIHLDTLQLQIPGGPLRAAFHVLHQLPSFWHVGTHSSSVSCAVSWVFFSPLPGFEPGTPRWEASIIPMCYCASFFIKHLSLFLPTVISFC